MQFAINYPDYASGVILLDTEAFMDIESICTAFEKRAGKETANIARQYLQKDQSTPTAFEQFFDKCNPLFSNNPIPDIYFKRAIIKPEVNAHMQIERATFNYPDDLHKIKVPVLYLTNTISPFHLLASAKVTASAMTNADVTFIAFENCGLVQLDAKEKNIYEINQFLEKYYPC